MTVAELEDYRAKLRAMDHWDLDREYRINHNLARSPDHLPSPRAVQQFVQCWKELRRRRGFGRR